MGSKITGFDKLYDDLDKLQKNAKSIDGTNDVDFKDLFSTKFMTNHTNTDDIYDFIEKSKLDIKNSDDFDKVQNSNEWNSYVKNSSDFNSWDEMQESALQNYISDNLFKGL
ncbi:hypothetical protein AB6F13_01365 [Staphylococcus saprophyticus]|uniref:hypothetical protein n=1 Tax=Staphylococcus saprophyticus TaxID=29385 RepID=UPI002975C1EF|nr:hypothetical protein [Staphylococcus saprophyticus]